jgi:hypothetical protein
VTPRPTISASTRRKLRDASRRTLAAGRMTMPSRHAERREGWVLHRVSMRDADDKSIDHATAARTFAGAWWAERARYLGIARGLHLWERPPEGER